MEAGNSIEIALVVNALSNGSFTNTVVVKSDENKTPANATSDNITVVPYVKLDIVKESNLDHVKVGELINFTITVTNNGKSNATNVRISDELNDAFGYINSSENSGRDGNLVYWDIENISPNETVKVHVTVNAIKEGTFTNMAIVSSNENETESNATKIIIIRNVVILNVTKVANVSALRVGDTIKFTITISNVGTEDATNVVISDVLGEEFGYVSSSNDGVYDINHIVTWNISSIAARTSTEVTLIVKALTNGTFKNTAVAKAKENDTYFNDSSDNITVEPDVKLAISKVANVTSAVVGDEIVFTITVTNNGLSKATDVVISDVLNDAFGFVDATSEFSYDENIHFVTWTIDSIDSNSSKTVSVVVCVLTNGTFANMVNVNARENNTNVTNSSDDIPIEPDVDLSIVKTANVTSAYVGDKIEFTITVTNNGLSNATNVIIEDVLPDSVKFISANGNYVNDGQNVKWTIDKVEGNSSVSVRVVVTAVSNGFVVNFANVTCSENSTSNTTTDDIDVKPVVNLTVVKTANVSDIFVGDRVSYNIVVTNNGPSNASNVIVVDELPNGLRFISSNVECVIINNKLIWTVSKLAAGENITIEVICEAVESGDLTNTVNVTCDENKTNTTGGTPIHVNDLVDVAIQLSVDNSTPYINGEITLTVTVINYGPSTATEIKGKLNRDFLTGLSIISIDSNGIKFTSQDLLGYTIMNILRVNDDGSFEIASLAPGEQVTATIKARVIHDGNITVDGNVTEHETDSNLANNHDEITLTVRPVTELDVEVTANETEPTVGDVIEYTITVTNNGPSNATGIIVNDKLPDGVTYVSDDSEGKYNPQTGVWSFDSLKTNETKTLTIKVKVNKAGEITNVVNVKSRENPEGTTGNATINAQDSKVDLIITKTVSTAKAYVGDIIVYTITITNKGTTDATGVLVYEDLLDGLKYLSDDGNGLYDFNRGIWNIGTLKSGETKVLNLVVQVTKVGNITNFVIIGCNQEIVDLNQSYDNVTVEGVEHEKPIENTSDNGSAKQIKAGSKATGNPFVMLIIALLIAGVGLRRRKE